MTNVRTVHKRERQLDAISTVLVLALLATLALLLYFLSTTGVQLPEASPLAEYATRVLLGGFTILLLLYLSDQRRRLRAQVAESVDATESARKTLDSTVSWLTFSHTAASMLGAEGVESGLKHVLADAAALLEADAAAVIGNDFDDVFVRDGVSQEEAERALMHVSVESAGHPEPLLLKSLGAGQGQAIAVPLRVSGELRFMLCAWRTGEPFQPEQLDALGLMGRMVEMAIERDELLDAAQSQLEGTLNVLQFLVAEKRPDYSRHAMRVADMAAEIGRQMAAPSGLRKSLRLAGLIHDVGIMSMPRDMAHASRELTQEERMVMQQHPRIGSEIALAAHFDISVQQMVAGHHERLDGSGYPKGLKGDQMSLGARIMAVCEVFDSMAHRGYVGVSTGVEDALSELRQHAGVLYDVAVVRALVEGIAPQEGIQFVRPHLEDVDARLPETSDHHAPATVKTKRWPSGLQVSCTDVDAEVICPSAQRREMVIAPGGAVW